jgi:polyhydroxyalkanoate synthesis regulator phasin
MTRARARAKSARPAKPLAQLRDSVVRLQATGERIVTRIRRDARSLLKQSRSEIVRDTRKLQRDLQRRAERTIRDIEQRVVRGFHAATADQVRSLERRVKRLERQAADLERHLGGGRAA